MISEHLNIKKKSILSNGDFFLLLILSNYIQRTCSMGFCSPGFLISQGFFPADLSCPNGCDIKLHGRLAARSLRIIFSSNKLLVSV